MSRSVEASPRLVRQAAVAGSFYPASADRLDELVRALIDAAARLPGAGGTARQRLPTGLLVPHAGLVYSGMTAAAAWSRLDVAPGRAERADEEPGAPLTVVILGTNHGAGWLDGVAAWSPGAWRTPFGEVPVDDALAGAILALGAPYLLDLEAHELEHSIEVQLPLLQRTAPGARIVPLSVSCGQGPWAVDAGRRLGDLLAARRAAGERIVLAVSSDMAHYPAAAACARVTAELLPPILAVDAPALASREAEIRAGGTRGLACGMCGIEPAVLGLAALREMGAVRATMLASATSADAGGPSDRTVGYLAVRFDA